MEKLKLNGFVILNAAVVAFLACSFTPDLRGLLPLPLFIFGLIAVNVLPFFVRRLPGLRLRFCGHGELCLKTFALVGGSAF